jgi:hypothetical protein
MTIFAPFASSWSKAFSPRIVTLAGALLFSLGNVLASFGFYVISILSPELQLLSIRPMNLDLAFTSAISPVTKSRPQSQGPSGFPIPLNTKGLRWAKLEGTKTPESKIQP